MGAARQSTCFELDVQPQLNTRLRDGLLPFYSPAMEFTTYKLKHSRSLFGSTRAMASRSEENRKATAPDSDEDPTHSEETQA